MNGNILKEIFFDENKSWDRFVNINRKNTRKIVMEEVEKFRLCGKKETGLACFHVKCMEI